MLKKKYFQFTRRQILLAILFASLAVTVAYNIGLYNGKRVMLDAEIKEAEMIEKGMFSSLEDKLYKEEFIELNTEMLPKRKDKREIPKSDGTLENLVRNRFNREQFYVKVGTFNQKSNAQNLVEQLKIGSYKPWIKEEARSGKRVYYVLFGGFDSEASARAFGERLRRRSGLINEYLIIRNP